MEIPQNIFLDCFQKCKRRWENYVHRNREVFERDPANNLRDCLIKSVVELFEQISYFKSKIIINITIDKD